LLGEPSPPLTDRNHRVVCLDELRFAPDGAILPVVITRTGVALDPLQPGRGP
jgi:hypothetical protein